jgi:predicted metal-dependent phosphotriesterase family hydrolase
MKSAIKSTLEAYTGKIMTVTGPIDPQAMGFCLPHEHVMSTFGADSARYPSYDRDKLFNQVLPYLQQISAYGCQTLVDCTATHFGRHPELLREVSQRSGLTILTNTGYYGAADDKYVPPHAFDETADQIAGRWVREWVFSIDDTGIRPGFIKTAIDQGPLSEIDRKLVIAAARTHLQTGLPIQTHTGDNWEGVQEILSILSTESVDPGAWIWVHAHQHQDSAHLVEAAGGGAWISLDGIHPESSPHILKIIHVLKEHGHLQKVLLSHDGDSYFGEGEFRPYHYIFIGFISQLEQAGFSGDEIRQLTVDNPQRAFTLGVRRLADR